MNRTQIIITLVVTALLAGSIGFWQGREQMKREVAAPQSGAADRPKPDMTAD